MYSIETSLYLGPYHSTYDLKILNEKKISLIINAANEKECPHLQKDHVKYFCCDLGDRMTQVIKDQFENTNKLIEEEISKGNSVLVHCAAGQSRSAAIVLAFIMKNKKMKLEEAFSFVKSKKENIGPNCGFMQQLMEYEETIHGKKIGVQFYQI
eukprot:TRINITY_DN5736_c0_g1_i1.p1 TRINITY_DN5736_c0_g1~~TRINITY_DN5736_c0_g1_i1.p1  ORF type:complete len:154 (-),score=28.98 TRINITY_DN5736_c0_g1_i1:39-500(-)